MKKILLFSFAFAALLVGQISRVNAQPCIVDPVYTSPGIYPSDTLQDMQVSVATNQVIQFVFPDDTTISGFTLPFDSFVVSAVSNIPNGLNWQCNQNHPVCLYVTTPGQLTRGCVLIDGTPTAASPAYPAYDSIIVTGTAYVDIPFIGVTPISQDIPVYYRTASSGSATVSPFSNAGLKIAPVPVAGTASVLYTLSSDALVKVSVMDLMGREVAVLSNGMQRQGEQELMLDSKTLAGGAYLLKLVINDGESVQTKKFTSIR